ncbi:MAG: formyltetrahydrofolate deformylase [Cyclobacteriaceae bacterium]
MPSFALLAKHLHLRTINSDSLMTSSKETATLLIHCPDQGSLIATVTQFLSRHHGNIIDLDEHVDTEEEVFFMRVAWQMEGFSLAKDELRETFAQEIAAPLQMTWSLHFSDRLPRMAIFVSKMSHCLYDLLSRVQSGEWKVEIPLIVSNHPQLETIAERFDMPFHHLPITPKHKHAQEIEQLQLLESAGVDFIVLARYMQILSQNFINQYPNRIINIHHSFLPAFPGAKPYHSAHKRGVKLIGATSHYVTADLDAGPIIAQDVAHISHKDSVSELVRKGRDLEKIVLSRAVYQHLQRKTLVFNNRTVVFD